MQLKRLVWGSFAGVMALALAACNIGKSPEPTPDVSAIYTSAAQTMIAGLNIQQTKTAGAVTATPLSSPTPQTSPTSLATFAISTGSIFGTPFTVGTPGAGVTPFATLSGGTPASMASGCDNLAFIADVNVPDGTVMRPGRDFTKIWTVQNTGTCTWDEGYVLVYQGGTLDGHDWKFNSADRFFSPGEVGNITQELTASLEPNTYTDCWRMRNDAGAYFGSYICVVIKVEE